MSDELWTAVQQKAAAEKVTVTSVIIAALEAYISEESPAGVDSSQYIV